MYDFKFNITIKLCPNKVMDLCQMSCMIDHMLNVQHDVLVISGPFLMTRLERRYGYSTEMPYSHLSRDTRHYETPPSRYCADKSAARSRSRSRSRSLPMEKALQRRTSSSRSCSLSPVSSRSSSTSLSSEMSSNVKSK